MKLELRIPQLITLATLLWTVLSSHAQSIKEDGSLDGDVVVFSEVKYYSKGDSVGRRLWGDADIVPDAMFVPNVKLDDEVLTYSIDSSGNLLLQSAIQHGEERDKGIGIDRGIVIVDSKPAVVRWITDDAFVLTATIEKFVPAFPDDIAGLLLYHDAANSILIGKSLDYSGRDCVKIIATRDGRLTHTATFMLSDAFTPVDLKIIAADNGKYIFMAAENHDILRYVGIPIPNFDTPESGNEVMASNSSPKFDTPESRNGIMAGVYAKKKRVE